jgi:NAD(P)-dependent dehydrogenase (short-subunit alcohol dehydrogenase family)
MAAVNRVAVVLGARNLGGAILDHLVGEGWRVAAVARSEDTLSAVRERGSLALAADASDLDQLGEALTRVRGELGPPRLIVNAVSASRLRPATHSAAARSPTPRSRASAAGRPRSPSRRSSSSRPASAPCGSQAAGR